MPHSTYPKKKSFHLLEKSVCTFCELKSPKWKQPLNISENGFYKQVLEFHCPSNLCQTPRRQNHWSLPYTNLCCSLSCFWTCLYYSSLCHLWTVDISVLHQTVLPGRICQPRDHAASGRICSKVAGAAWTGLFYRNLCCLWTYLF